jgi:hypothetical protein
MHGPQIVRTRILVGASEMVQERRPAPGEQWPVTVSRAARRLHVEWPGHA